MCNTGIFYTCNIHKHHTFITGVAQQDHVALQSSIALSFFMVERDWCLIIVLLSFFVTEEFIFQVADKCCMGWTCIVCHKIKRNIFPMPLLSEQVDFPWYSVRFKLSRTNNHYCNCPKVWSWLNWHGFLSFTGVIHNLIDICCDDRCFPHPRAQWNLVKSKYRHARVWQTLKDMWMLIA